MKLDLKSRVFSAKGEPYESSLELLSSIRVKLAERVKGKNVMIKPHVIGNEDFNTPPEVLEAISDALQMADPLSTFLVGDPARLKDLGYEKLGFETLDLGESGHAITLRSTLTGDEAELVLPSKLKDPDVFIISCSPIKTHFQHILMCSLTNMLDLFKDGDDVLGASEGERSIGWMHENIAQCLQEIMPDLSLIDGNNSLEGNGPLDGYHISLDISLLSFDPVAADSVAAYLAGFDPYEIGYLYFLERSGVGVADLSKIDLIGAELVPHAFKRPRNYYKLVFSP
jgi:uncharacterized protein (DUF362 family)